MSFKPPGNCPVCDEHVPHGLVSCPQCGSCSRSGWGDEIGYDGLDLPDDSADFNYDDYVSREFSGPEGKPKSDLTLWQWVGLILVVIMILATLLSARF